MDLTNMREFRADRVRDCLQSEGRRVFLLSPANIAGIRGRFVTREGSDSAMAGRLRQEGVPLGELFSFMSGLYFRGKLAYARAFAEVPPYLDGAFIVTASGGLMPPDTLITLERLRQISSGEVDP